MIATKYDPSDIEGKWYDYWMKNGFFHSEPDKREPYTIVIPPPNVTGVLHMGHMLNNTIQDILIRRARMMGKNACWVPGTDHASIATEARVVAKLAGQGIKKTDLTRDQFLEHAWEWTHKHGGIILEQLKKLGASCDWDRTCFTMDEKRSKSVIKVFVDLYNKGLIYRGIRMVNWDPKAKTALSDEEVNYKEQQGKLYYLRYKIVSACHSDESQKPQKNEESAGKIPYLSTERNDCKEYAIIATTRPETILGDTAVCINPNDPKNAYLKGKKVIVPIAGREVPIIEDEYVDIEFGTGCLKITPAHDVNDYMLGEKYHLPAIDIFNDDGTLNHHGLHYEGKDRFEVRRLIEEELIEKGLMEKMEPYENKVGFSERTNVPIEPKLSTQWFLKMEELAKPALDAVMNDTIRLIPAKFKNMYRHWMENIKDWCISRQLWWGHRIPAYYLPEGGLVVAETKEEAYKKALSVVNYQLSIENLRQDEDCLDTWFSSWLWPISVFDGINNPDNKDICYYYPTNDLVTAPEIIFFWVARMIISGYEYRHEACFHNVYFTGLVRDKLGRKMSKSLGNSPDPIELMDKYGADGVRMGMLLTSPAGNDLPFDEALCEQGRSFCIKIWNAYRLINGWEVDGKTQPKRAFEANITFRDKLSETRQTLHSLFRNYKLSEAIKLLYSFFYDEFASTYLEAVKPDFMKPVDKITYNNTIHIFEESLKLLHPFIPFITEEIWHNIRKRKDGQSIMLQPITKGIAKNEKRRQTYEKAKEIITNIRNIRASKNLSPNEKLTLQVVGEHDTLYDEIIVKLAKVNLENVNEKLTGAISFMVGTTEYAVFVGNLIDIAEELAKLREELKYQQGFLELVLEKLNNENFTSKAPQKVIEMERKKQTDTESKIKSLQESIAALE